MSVKAKRYQLIELQKAAAVTGAGTKLYFQDQPLLRSIGAKLTQLTAIAAYCDEDAPLSPGGRAVATPAQFRNAFLVLNQYGTETMLYIPLVQLRATQGDTANIGNQVFPFELMFAVNIDWTKSYIQFAADPTAAVFSFLFGVWYLNLPDDILNPIPPSMPGAGTIMAT